MAQVERCSPGGICGLIQLLEKHGSAVEADLISLGLRLRDVGKTPEFTYHDLYVICANSTRSSALVRSLHGSEASWGLTEHLLATVADYQAILIWQKTKDGQKNRNRPKPIDRPGQKTTEKTLGTKMSIEDADKWLQANGVGVE
jgi:hypothetical protein